MKNPGRKKKKKKKKYPGKKLTGVKTNEHQFRSPVVSPQDYFDDIQRRSWETSDAWSNQLVHGPWQMNNLRGNCGLHQAKSVAKKTRQYACVDVVLYYITWRFTKAMVVLPSRGTVDIFHCFR